MRHHFLLFHLPLESSIFYIKLMLFWVICDAVFLYWISKKVQCILCIAVFLILLDNYKSTCPEVKWYLLQNHSVTHWNSTFLAEKCWGTGRNVKMSWQYICHCIQWEKEKILKLNYLQALLIFLKETKTFFCFL